MLKAVIFDLDGVLIQTENIHLQTVERLFSEICGYTLSEADKELVVGRHRSDYVPEIMAAHQLDATKSSQLMDGFDPLYDGLWEQQVTLMPDVKEVLQTLRDKGINLSLASNSTIESVQRFINRFGFEGFFDPITSGEEVAKKKPDPHIYQIAFSKLNLSKSEILVVEDSEVGVNAAHAAGLAVAAVPNQYTAREDFKNASFNFKTLKEILTLF